MKKLKYWNGRGHGMYSRHHISVAAYTQKQAAELVSRACYPNSRSAVPWINVREIREYYSPCWGDDMDGVVPDAPCLYVKENGAQRLKII